MDIVKCAWTIQHGWWLKDQTLGNFLIIYA